ncbi:HK97-gp10 family putative phage morphogenesis protein [Occultella kanbiaonis]|uniref:HK97-gp10 family putative phage morphogenesis protein n=1 Tax=Occultella kanbiaonis TaxID=2675754 RepID=UPI001F3A379B|nr:HK97-gp10 family putative phage morphogenesis protein [Occultella kanbiaonis]
MVFIDGSGFHTLAAELGAKTGRMGQLAQVVVRKTALDIERDAKAFVPVDTGNLRSSISHSDLRGVGQSGVLEAEVGPTANYGHFVEFGTSQHGPAAYMGPAMDRNAPAFADAMAQLVEDLF